jgi:uric acid transporter
VPQGKILGDKVFGGQASGTSLVSVQTGWRRWSKPCPLVVLGGAGLVMFGMVAATGARILTAVDFKNNHHNLFVAALSVGFGMIPLVSPTIFKNLPHDLHPSMESGILLSAIVAVALNAFFNGIGSKTARRS